MNSILGCEIPPFKIADYIPKSYRKSSKVMARDIIIAVACACEAVRHANLATKCTIGREEADGEPAVDSTRFGANIGAGLICADLQELAGALQTCGNHQDGSFDLKKWGAEGMDHLTPLWLLKFLPNMLGCHVTIVHDAQAPSNTLTCGEASSHLAVGEAFRTIARGAADVCICGGAESKMNPMGVMRQQLIGRLLSGHDDEPEDACHPFDTSRDGMIAAEGGGLLILEELQFAKNRGARIIAELAGFGAGTSIAHWHGAEPDGSGTAIAIRNALKDANVAPGDIDLICPFATGCNDFDSSELTALEKSFPNRKDIAGLAIKGATGNGGAGAGAVDLAVTALAVHNQTVPPSKNTQSSNTGGLLKFESKPTTREIKAALSSAYSLGGNQCAAIVIKKYEE